MSSLAAFETCLAQARELEPLMVKMRPHLPPSPQYQDLEQGLTVLLRYIRLHTPEILQGNLRVLDVGPGVGCFLMLARAFGNHVMGDELDPSVGGERVAAYKEILDALKLDVSYGGFHRYLTQSGLSYPNGPFDFIHFRGSLDAVLNPLRADLEGSVERLIEVLYGALRPGGTVHISHNDDGMREGIIMQLHLKGAKRFIVTDLLRCGTQLLRL